MSAGAEGASMISLPRLGDAFLASESFFFSGLTLSDGAHFFNQALLDFINQVRTDSPVESVLIEMGQMRVHCCSLIDR